MQLIPGPCSACCKSFVLDMITSGARDRAEAEPVIAKASKSQRVWQSGEDHLRTRVRLRMHLVHLARLP
jgi:hypothetical protein